MSSIIFFQIILVRNYTFYSPCFVSYSYIHSSIYPSSHYFSPSYMLNILIDTLLIQNQKRHIMWARNKKIQWKKKKCVHMIIHQYYLFCSTFNLKKNLYLPKTEFRWDLLLNIHKNKERRKKKTRVISIN